MKIRVTYQESRPRPVKIGTHTQGRDPMAGRQARIIQLDEQAKVEADPLYQENMNRCLGNLERTNQMRGTLSKVEYNQRVTAIRNAMARLNTIALARVRAKLHGNIN